MEALLQPRITDPVPPPPADVAIVTSAAFACPCLRKPTLYVYPGLVPPGERLPSVQKRGFGTKFDTPIVFVVRVEKDGPASTTLRGLLWFPLRSGVASRYVVADAWARFDAAFTGAFEPLSFPAAPFSLRQCLKDSILRPSFGVTKRRAQRRYGYRQREDEGRHERKQRGHRVHRYS